MRKYMTNFDLLLLQSIVDLECSPSASPLTPLSPLTSLVNCASPLSQATPLPNNSNATQPPSSGRSNHVRISCRHVWLKIPTCSNVNFLTGGNSHLWSSYSSLGSWQKNTYLYCKRQRATFEITKGLTVLQSDEEESKVVSREDDQQTSIAQTIAVDSSACSGTSTGTKSQSTGGQQEKDSPTPPPPPSTPQHNAVKGLVSRYPLYLMSIN